MTSTAPRQTRMTADERRDAIVAAGIEEFATGGLVGASTDAIARRAGVSQPYVFQLFGTKKDLFLAVVGSCFSRIILAFEDAAARWTPGDEICNSALMAMGLTYKKLLADRTLLLMQLQSYAACSDPDVRTAVRDGFAGLGRLFEEVGRHALQGLLLVPRAPIRSAQAAADREEIGEGLLLTRFVHGARIARVRIAQQRRRGACHVLGTRGRRASTTASRSAAASASSGTTRAAAAMPSESTSSTMETSGLAVPSVSAVDPRRTLALAPWIANAISASTSATTWPQGVGQCTSKA